jgi:hypothetical protein
LKRYIKYGGVNMRKWLLFLVVLFLTACNEDLSENANNESVDFETGCEDPDIKGNLTTYNGEKIYHVPGGAYYSRTDAEEMFCTEEEAEEAGYRKSQR